MAGVRGVVPILALTLGLGGCLAPQPCPEDWLDYGFRGPEQTFRAFLTALAGDRPDLEYRCLSQSFKDRHQGSLMGYLLFRDQLFDDMPWLKAAARAEVESVEDLGPRRARVHARVDWLFWDEPFHVDLVREDFYEYWSGDERIGDDFFDFRPSAEDRSVVLRLPPPEDYGLHELTEVRAGSEWKIDAILLIQPPHDPDPTP